MLTPKIKKADFIIKGQKIRFKQDDGQYVTRINGTLVKVSTLIEARNIASSLLRNNG